MTQLSATTAVRVNCSLASINPEKVGRAGFMVRPHHFNAREQASCRFISNNPLRVEPESRGTKGRASRREIPWTWYDKFIDRTPLALQRPLRRNSAGEQKNKSGRLNDVADATYIVKADSSIRDFASLDQSGVKVAAVNNTTTMRGAQAHLKKTNVTEYQTYDKTFELLKNGSTSSHRALVVGFGRQEIHLVIGREAHDFGGIGEIMQLVEQRFELLHR